MIIYFKIKYSLTISNINHYSIKNNHLKMYTAQIIWLISWPVFIYISYRLVLFALKKFEGKITD